MKDILAHLERILERLSTPESLEAEEVGYLAQDWDHAILQLEAFPQGEAFKKLSSSERLYLRVRLERIMERTPEIEALLVTHKSAIAQQIFTENRRFQSLHSRYLASFDGTARMHHKA